MTEYTILARHLNGVVAACTALYGSMTGSGDALSEQRFNELIDWLSWRITDGWLPTDKPTLATRRYDNAVRNLARATLCMAMSR